MATNADGDRLLKKVARIFWKPRAAGVTTVWNELRAEKCDLEEDPKAAEAQGGQTRYRVPGISDEKFKMTIWGFETMNIRQKPWRISKGKSGTLHIFETDPPVDSRKHVCDVFIEKVSQPIYGDEGAVGYEVEFSKSGKYREPGELLTAPSTYYGTDYDDINPDGDACPMDINNET